VTQANKILTEENKTFSDQIDRYEIQAMTTKASEE
jgi:chromosome segregation ATPase